MDEQPPIPVPAEIEAPQDPPQSDEGMSKETAPRFTALRAGLCQAWDMRCNSCGAARWLCFLLSVSWLRQARQCVGMCSRGTAATPLTHWATPRTWEPEYSMPRRVRWSRKAPTFPTPMEMYGTRLLATAGVLNLLAALHAYEAARGRKA